MQPTLLCRGTVYGGVGVVSEREQCHFLGSHPTFSHFPHFPQVNRTLPGAALVLIPGWVCTSRTLWAPPTDSPVRLAVSPTTATPTGFLQLEVLRLYYPELEPWVVWSVSLPSCSSWFICMQIWDCLVHQPPRHTSSLPQLPVSAPPTSLDECFFFNLLVV